MKIAGEYRIEADRETVWRAINDPDILRQCIPGCEEVIRETPTDWTAKVTARVGPVKARFAGKIRLEDLDPPAGCRIVGEGTGGAAGFAKGGAIVTLAEHDRATILRYDADAQIGGKLAQIGSRLVDSFARKYADDFFATFAQVVSAGAAGGDAPSPGGNGASPLRTAVAADSLAGVQIDRAPAPSPLHAPYSPVPRPMIDSQTITILVLSALLVFMTVMYAMKP